MEVIKEKIEHLHQFGKKIPHIVQLRDKTGVEEGFIILGALVLSVLLILIFMGGTILSVILTVVYPAFKSIKALETKGDDDDKIWLTYWCVFGIFSLVDEFGGIILSLIPFYYYIRLVFFVWMMHPSTQGATTVYKTVLKPLLSKNKDKIEKLIKDITGGASSAMKEGASFAAKELSKPEHLITAASYASQAKEQADKLNQY